MSSFLNSLKKVFFFWQKGAILGIDIGASSIKVVLIEKVEEKIFLRNYGSLALGPGAGLPAGQVTNFTPEKIAEELRELLKEAKISPARTFIAIPLNASLLSIVELPNVGNKELESMIPIEARRYIPVSLNEVSLDWWVLPTKQSAAKKTATEVAGTQVPMARPEKVEVIIAAIHNEVVSKYESIKRSAQIPGASSQFEIEIFSTLRAVVGRDLTPTLVVDLGAATTKFALVDQGVVHASHVISMGSQDITLGIARSQGISFDKAEEMKCRYGMVGDNEGRDVLAVAELLFANITNEISRFINNYEQKHESKVSKIMLVGGGANLIGLDKLVSNGFPHVSVERGDPFTRLDSPAFLSKTLKEIGPDFATAVGVALKGLE